MFSLFFSFLLHSVSPLQNFEVKADDLEPIMELGRGAYGVVEKMRHVPSGQIMAVKVEWTFPKGFLSVACAFVHPQCEPAFFTEAKPSFKGEAENIICREQIALQMCGQYFLNYHL